MKELVFMEHDGAIDDLLSQILLLSMPDKELIGINITPADCFLEPAVESSYKILELFGRTDIPIGCSDYYGVNAFPNEWRARPEVINALPMMINLPKGPDPYTAPHTVDLLIGSLQSASRPVSILMTGPCSNLVMALEKAPSIQQKISKVIWMGGAFRCQGNVQNFQHDGTAEWNVYWDPMRAAKLLTYELPLIFIPLDVTNQVPVKKSFLSELARQAEYPISNLAGQCWALTIDTIPTYHYVYFMWDILATSYLDIPEAFQLEDIRLRIGTRPPNAGQTYLADDGHAAQMAVKVDVDHFYEYLLERLRR
ncbi:MAG: nucleoside hydrolase [Bacteroidota bacterium]